MYSYYILSLQFFHVMSKWKPPFLQGVWLKQMSSINTVWEREEAQASGKQQLVKLRLSWTGVWGKQEYSLRQHFYELPDGLLSCKRPIALMYTTGSSMLCGTSEREFTLISNICTWPYFLHLYFNYFNASVYSLIHTHTYTHTLPVFTYFGYLVKRRKRQL